MTRQVYRDLRLQADAFGLIELLGAVLPTREDIESTAQFAGLSLGTLTLGGTAENGWAAVAARADSEGRFDVLLSVLQKRMSKDHRLPELAAWINSMGVREISDISLRIRDRHRELVSASDPSSLGVPVEATSLLLVSLARQLANTHRARIAFGDLPDAERLVRRTRDMARQASAAVDVLLFQVREFGSYREQAPFTASDRGAADRTLGEFALVEHLFRQRAAADSCLSSLLDLLIPALALDLNEGFPAERP